MPDFSTWIAVNDLISIGLVIIIAIVGRFLLVRLVRGVTKRAVTRAQTRREHQTNAAEKLLSTVTMANNERYEQRATTLGSVITSVVSIAVWTIAVLTIMDILKVPMAPLLTSAGVGGVALAFGAQSLVKDFLSGIFMIMEDQYGVGDLVNTGEVTGTVEEVGLRVTRLRDATGTVWYVRNGEILRIGNQSQGWSTAIVDVPVAYDEDGAKVIGILETVAAEMATDPDYADVLLDKPTVAGVNAVTATAMTIRMMAKTATNQHWAVQRSLLERSLAALGKAGVRSPAVYPYPNGTGS
ncbi:MAG TPA: mechanosensitive ion channel family protein [Propionicimonas sp.]|nr:mechanosensitive ion channel family protein [Propionicimonas sp.]HRA06277.1 mechanosensitive ion channel family protein [Propionicimonas sp.]